MISVVLCIIIKTIVLQMIRSPYLLKKEIFHLEVLQSLVLLTLTKPIYSTKKNVVSWLIAKSFRLHILLIFLLGLRSWSSSRLPPPVTSKISPVVLPSGRCNRHLIGSTGRFSPPDSYYRSNTECIWVIEVPEGYNVRVTFYNVQIE